MFPIRCFTCNKVIANKYLEYENRTIEKKEEKGKVLDDLGMKRYCCRRMFLSHIDTFDELLLYSIQKEENQTTNFEMKTPQEKEKDEKDNNKVEVIEQKKINEMTKKLPRILIAR